MSWDEVIPYSVIFEEAKRKKVEGLSGFDWCGKVFFPGKKKIKVFINKYFDMESPTYMYKQRGTEQTINC